MPAPRKNTAIDLELLAVIALVALALIFDFTNGFHDAANSVATVVATKAMPAKWAVWFSGAFNFLAYFLVGTAVANTVAKVVNGEFTGIAVIFAALIAAITWNYATWWIGMPSSSSHALIGGLVGAGLSAGGAAAINWSAVQKTALAIVASPFVAFTIAFLAMYLVLGIQRVSHWRDDAKPFKVMQLVSAAAVSLGHGANDAQKTMGVIAALLVGTGHLTPAEDGSITVPEWTALAAYSAIAVGTIWGGWKIIETMGLKITTLHASSGVAANIGATTAIFGATQAGIPISTTHAAASSVMGAGISSGRGINLKIVGEMVLAWVITIPATLTIAFCVHSLTKLPTWGAVISIGSLMFVLGGAILYAMTHSMRAEDLEAELADDVELAEHVPAHPKIEGHGQVE